MTEDLLIDFEEEPEGRSLNFGFDPAETAVRVVGRVLELERCPFRCEFSLLLTGDERTREVNRDARGIDSVTDVLSFPVCGYSKPAAFEEAEEDCGGCFDPENGFLILGDILINAEQAGRQALEYGHSLLREYAFLVAHSALHLVGYDHMTEDDERLMIEKQNLVLDSLNIRRGNE